jgi:predicted PurR-regulated permease PerM
VTSAAAPRRVAIAPIITAVVVTGLLLWLLGAAVGVFLILFIGVLLSLYLGAVRDWIVRRVHMPRGVAFAIAVFGTFGAVIGLLALLVPPVVAQTRQLLGLLPAYIASWEAGLQRFAERVPAAREIIKPGEHQLVDALYGQAVHLFDSALPTVVSFFHLSINVFSIAVISIYLALNPGVYREWLIALFPPVHRDLARDVLADLGTQLRAWIVAQLLAMFSLAVLTAIGLYLLHVPYWLTFGIFTGAVAIVPFFGTLVSTTLPALFVLGGAGIWGFTSFTHALFVAVLGTVIHVIEANVVVPLIVADRAHLPPVLTITAVLLAGTLVGPAGLLVAVPTLVVVMVVVRRILISRIYEGQGFRRVARDRVLVLRVPAPDGGVLVPSGPVPDLIAIAERDGSAKIA